jgi:NAD(P)H-flavin reductase
MLCQLRGPYGSPFTKCYDPKYKGVVVIGAGTGLTSALSVLKEMVQRHLKGESA